MVSVQHKKKNIKKGKHESEMVQNSALDIDRCLGPFLFTCSLVQEYVCDGRCGTIRNVFINF